NTLVHNSTHDFRAEGTLDHDDVADMPQAPARARTDYIPLAVLLSARNLSAASFATTECQVATASDHRRAGANHRKSLAARAPPRASYVWPVGDNTACPPRVIRGAARCNDLRRNGLVGGCGQRATSRRGCTIAADRAPTGIRSLQSGSQAHRYGGSRVTTGHPSAIAQGAAGAGNPPPPARHGRRPRTHATTGPGSRPGPGRLFESRSRVRPLPRADRVHRFRRESPPLALGRVVAPLRGDLLARDRNARGIRHGPRLGVRARRGDRAAAH